MIRIATLIFDDSAYRRIHNAFRDKYKSVELVVFDKPADLAEAVIENSIGLSGVPIHAIIIELHDLEGRSTSPVIQRIHRKFPELPVVAYMDHSPQRVRELLVAVRAGVNEVILREYDDLTHMAEMILRMIESVKVSRRVTDALVQSFGHIPEWIPAFIRCVIRNAYSPSGVYRVEMELGKNRKAISGNLATAGMPGISRIMSWGRKLVDANMADENSNKKSFDKNFDRLLGLFMEEMRNSRNSQNIRVSDAKSHTEPHTESGAGAQPDSGSTN